MNDIEDAKDRIVRVRRDLALAEAHLNGLLASDTRVEEMARRLWVMWVEQFEPDNAHMVKDWTANTADRDHDWFSLTTGGERDKFRNMAATFCEHLYGVE